MRIRSFLAGLMAPPRLLSPPPSLPTSLIRSRTEIERDRQNFRMLPKGGGYRERDATKTTLDPARAHVDVTTRRERFRELMHEREMEIDLGFEHLTPAAEEIKRKRGSL